MDLALYVPFLLLAGLIAGIVGTAGGITSLVSYPALLATGMAPFPANVTNLVSLVGSGFTATLASKPELRNHRRRLRAISIGAALSGSVGAALLLVTPADVFARVVPALIVLASVLVLAAPRITTALARRERADGRTGLWFGVFAVSIYGGYFGAG
ncbi:MAG TPA: sulfite exporter TauE/SafE family protein, partial [Micromonosporaceae bacterium]